MKTFAKLAIGLGVLAIAGYVIFDMKRTKKEIARRKKENKDFLMESGLDEEEIIREELVPDDDEVKDGIDCGVNLSGSLFNAALHCPELDLDAISTEAALSGRRHVVHITQSCDRRKKCNVLNFLFEVPYSALGIDSNNRRPEDGYVNSIILKKTLHGSYNHEEEVFYESAFFKEVKNIVAKGVKNNLDKVLYGATLDPFAYIRFMSKDEDGNDVEVTRLERLTNDMMGWTRNYQQSEFVKVIHESDETYKMIGSEGEDVTVLDTFMAVRISFVMQDRFNPVGINTETGVEIIKKIYDSLEIEGERWNAEPLRYDGFLFYKEREVSDIKLEIYTENGLEEIEP